MENYFLSPQKQTKEEMMDNISKYLETRVTPLLNPLQTQLLLKRPRDIAKFSLEWLKQDSKPYFMKNLKHNKKYKTDIFKICRYKQMKISMR